MTPEKTLAIVLGALLLLIVIMVLAGMKRHTDERRWSNKRVSWDYTATGCIALVDVKGEFVAIARSPQDRDTARLRRIAMHYGYIPPRYNIAPLSVK